MRKPVLGVAFLFLFWAATAFSQSAVISFSPPSFSFTAVQSGSLPLSQTLQVNNSGGGTLGWQITSNANWLSATPASGTAPSNITVSITRTNLPPNTYSGKLTITGNASNSPQEVTVTYTVTAPITATIAFSPPSFNFNADQDGSLPLSETLQVSNSGGGTLNWNISSNANWLSATPASGTAPSNITVSITRTNLPPNTYSGKLTITGNATNSPQEVPVTYTVSAPPQPAVISLSPASFGFGAEQNGSLPLSQNLEITNTGGGSLNWSVSSKHNSTWLSAGPANGTAPSTVTASITTTGLVPNTYADTLVILSGDASNSPQEVPVTYTVTSAQTAVLSLTPGDTINFSASQGGDPTSPQTLQIRNTGSGSMTWSLGGGIPSWLSVIPPGPATAPTDVQLTAVPGSLVPGFYSHTLQVFSGQATNSPQSVVVNFEVTQPPVPVLQVSDDLFTFEATEGQANPAPQPLTIFNGGGGDLNWNLASDQTWLFPANASGTNTGNLSVSVSIANLAAGPHTGHLTITAAGASGSPRTVTVNLNIAPVL
ncbi:MAG TPA: BACON domain-containing carbohydrate-binding protein, partial [candidate division Zixibacteria bacterium]|nr:BACON domain-containing carbohydrate-binding protein [candidate division Zixibacteria bacterium]